MSANRLSYDPCSYKAALKQSVSPLEYTLDPIKYEHNTKCRVESGLVGGTAVSHIRGNMVDLENNLRGQTNPSTRCGEYLFNPHEPVQGKEYIKPVTHPAVDTTPMHLRECQFAPQATVPGACYSMDAAGSGAGNALK